MPLQSTLNYDHQTFKFGATAFYKMRFSRKAFGRMALSKLGIKTLCKVMFRRMAILAERHSAE
jgi:hypothetical protein